VYGNFLLFFITGSYKVRTRVVAVGAALPAEGAEVLKSGQKIFIKGRLGSKSDRNPDGSVTRSSHLVGKSIKLL